MKSTGRTLAFAAVIALAACGKEQAPAPAAEAPEPAEAKPTEKAEPAEAAPTERDDEEARGDRPPSERAVEPAVLEAVPQPATAELPTPAPATTELLVPPCPPSWKQLPPEAQAAHRCSCPPGGPSGPVWGTGIYTTDSSICAAAAHAGAITREAGGPVLAKAAPGCGVYKGSTSGGITSGDWGAYGASFVFPDHGAGTCFALPEGSCPDRYNDLPATAQAGEHTCGCPADVPEGPVWGTLVYTTDSSICTAARHAGAVGPDGLVTVRKAAGCARYEGSKAAGVTSGDWGAFPSSFWFAGAGTGECPKLPEGACPPTYRELTVEQQAVEHSCACAPGVGLGPVWGTGVFTTDSSICAAAILAGAITRDDGGQVAVRGTVGCRKYVGSSAGGVTSGDWGPFEASFYFPAKGGGSCPQVAADACPDSFGALPEDQRAGAVSCSCAADQARGPVWGTGVYTADSSICNAAVHAGVIPAEGGKVTVRGAPGCGRYAGTAAHGVTSGAWGPFGASFVFDGKAADCPTVAADACPGTYDALPPDLQAGEHACSCAADALVGSVWGTGVYTTDSSICAAALHAGAVGADGGKVTVKKAPGCARYEGTESNGVASGAWAAFQASFYFPAKGDGACAP